MLRDFDREEEAGAGGRDVEAGRVFRADLCLHEAGGRGKNHVGRDGGDEDEVDFVGGDSGLLHGGERGFGAPCRWCIRRRRRCGAP